MSGNSKPIASLSSGLLARKGQARPAMRPQAYAEPGAALDDLGWNDLGDAGNATRVQPLSADVQPATDASPPAVIEQRNALARQIADLPAGELERIRRTVAARKGKAAFTLRLDADRHMRLRLASAITGRSAQSVVTGALDQYLETLADVGALAAHLRDGDSNR
ncbi:hypothetical protein [Sphingomonas sp.]|uniref:hypothetical protein n=1 Tax=Sphingomonas sp. TaxID=28214 RepID=UPI002BD834F0|nr:hypothetical protein [Sphingomonas sp.]HTG37184.1 hypothetical protein [Sphingomonas sp.]